MKNAIRSYSTIANDLMQQGGPEGQGPVAPEVFRTARTVLMLLMCCVVTPLFAAPAGYPQKPIRLVVPFAPGGGFDAALRPLAHELSQRLEYPLVMDNRPGAGGIVGTEIVARASPDGYTLLGGSVGLSSFPALFKKLPFDPIKDFAPITVAVTSAYFLLVHPSVPAASVKDLIALAKKTPGQLHFASAGKGTTIHLAGEMLRTMAEIDIVQVPYKGAGPALTALAGGEIQLMFAPTGATTGLINAGKVKAIGVSSPRRWAMSPGTPTLAEAGLPGYEVSGWYGLLAPAGTSKAIIDKLYLETKKVLDTEAIRSRLSANSLEPLGLSPGQSAQFIAADTARWARVVLQAGIAKE